MKKQILTIGSILSIAVPAVVISCGGSSTQGPTGTQEHNEIGVQWASNAYSAGKVQLRYQPTGTYTLTAGKLSADDITQISSKIKTLFVASSHDKTGVLLVINNIERHFTLSSEVITEISRKIGELTFTTTVVTPTNTGAPVPTASPAPAAVVVNPNQAAADAFKAALDKIATIHITATQSDISHLREQAIKDLIEGEFMTNSIYSELNTLSAGAQVVVNDDDTLTDDILLPPLDMSSADFTASVSWVFGSGANAITITRDNILIAPKTIR